MHEDKQLHYFKSVIAHQTRFHLTDRGIHDLQQYPVAKKIPIKIFTIIDKFIVEVGSITNDCIRAVNGWKVADWEQNGCKLLTASSSARLHSAIPDYRSCKLVLYLLTELVVNYSVFLWPTIS